MNTKTLPPSWLALAVTGLSIIIFAATQQSYRTALNDPQVQMAQDAARLITAGVNPAVFAPHGAAVEVSESLAPWIAFYDGEGVPLSSSGLLHGAIPNLPAGVLETAGNRGEYRVTWQPEAGVRQAVVIVAYKNDSAAGYVVAGRNMSEADSRVRQMGLFVALGWVLTLAASLAAARVASRSA